jgi:uncharacterized membrane protein (DUF4010 family)
MALLLSTVSPDTLVVLGPALLAGGVVAVLYAAVFARPGSASSEPAGAEAGRAFSVVAALGLAALVAGLTIGTAALKQWLGTAGMIAGATIAGVVDAHAAGVSVASLVSSSGLTPREAVIPILAAMTTNAGSKIAMAIGVGSREFARRLVPGIVLSMAAAWAVAWGMGAL